MSTLIINQPTVFLVVTGGARADEIQNATAYQGGELTLRQHDALGNTIDLVVTAPENLVDYADVATATVLKPVCIPITLTKTELGRVRCTLCGDPVARDLARLILTAAKALPHPAQPAGVLQVKPKPKGKRK